MGEQFDGIRLKLVSWVVFVALPFKRFVYHESLSMAI